MSEELPDPIVPVDCDLRGMPFMPLDTARLIDSDFAAISTGEEFKAGIVLWCKAWQQVPAGSLPNDDRVLAHLSGTGTRWKKIREVALKGFVLCSDGRLYHPVIAEKALEAWGHRGLFREKNNNKASRQQRWREKQRELSERLCALGVDVPQGASLETLMRLLVDAGETSTGDAVDASEMPLTGTVTGTVKKEPHTARALASTQMRLDWTPDPDTWSLYAKRSGVVPGDLTPETLTEFTGYWHADGSFQTEAQWVHKLVSQIKNRKGRGVQDEKFTGTGAGRRLSAVERAVADNEQHRARREGSGGRILDA